MKPVSVVEIYTLKFCDSLILLKIHENLISTEKLYCNESRKSLNQKRLFKIYLSRFHFASAL